jgi:Relaxase/Mobilisation nuclease domain
MIIKSLSRKSRSFRPGARGGKSPFAALARYMNRGIETEDGRAVLWHNFYGSHKTREDDLIRDFEENAELLKERSNGNVLYHEILSFSKGHKLKEEELIRIVTDIGQAYLSDRARRQMAYGVIHQDTGHIHLHLMISSNAIGKPDRVRLSKKEFSDIQKRVEALALERYPELAQTKIYGRERPREKLKTDTREQAMKTRSPEPSRKESLKSKLHQLFEQSQTFKELADRAAAEGFSFYQRGKSVGVVVRDPDGTERRHRLSTLGVEVHYQLTNERINAKSHGVPPPIPTQEPDRPRPAPEGVGKRPPQPPTPEPSKAARSAPERFPKRPDAPDRSKEPKKMEIPIVSPLKREIEELIDEQRRAKEQQKSGRDDREAPGRAPGRSPDRDRHEDR